MPAMVQGSSNEVPSSFSQYTKVATTCPVNLSFDHFGSLQTSITSIVQLRCASRRYPHVPKRSEADPEHCRNVVQSKARANWTQSKRKVRQSDEFCEYKGLILKSMKWGKFEDWIWIPCFQVSKSMLAPLLTATKVRPWHDHSTLAM